MIKSLVRSTGKTIKKKKTAKTLSSKKSGKEGATRKSSKLNSSVKYSSQKAQTSTAVGGSLPKVGQSPTQLSESHTKEITDEHTEDPIILKPPKRDPNAIFITFGFSLFLIFSIATIYSLQFLSEVFAESRGDVMGQTNDEKIDLPVSNIEDDQLLIPEYLIKKGFSKGEINESAVDSFYLSWPVKSGMGIVTQCFSEEHPAIDIADYRSPKILASADGFVIFAGCFEEGCPVDPEIKNSEGLAQAIMIKHPNGMITVYGHLKSLFVKEGEQVSRGDVIGIMGNSGNSQAISESGAGIHLHYAIITDSSWNYLDPSKLMINKICEGGVPDPEAFWGQEVVVEEEYVEPEEDELNGEQHQDEVIDDINNDGNDPDEGAAVDPEEPPLSTDPGDTELIIE